MNNPFDLIDARLSNIETLLLDIKHDLLKEIKQKEADPWFDLKELCNYHPDNPSKQTVYGWVNKRLIPVHKSGKSLRFLKSEIDLWLKDGRKKTMKEIEKEAEQYIKAK